MPRLKWERYGRSGDWRAYSPRYGYVRIQHSRKTKKWYLVNDDYTLVLGVYDSKKEAQDEAESTPNPRKRRRVIRRAAKKRRVVRKNPRRRRNRTTYNTTIDGLRVRFFQGYADDIRYTRELDGKKYSHVVETDAAEIYLCEHATYGHCVLIVDPSGKTPLWK